MLPIERRNFILALTFFIIVYYRNLHTAEEAFVVAVLSAVFQQLRQNDPTYLEEGRRKRSYWVLDRYF